MYDFLPERCFFVNGKIPNNSNSALLRSARLILGQISGGRRTGTSRCAGAGWPVDGLGLHGCSCSSRRRFQGRSHCRYLYNNCYCCSFHYFRQDLQSKYLYCRRGRLWKPSFRKCCRLNRMSTQDRRSGNFQPPFRFLTNFRMGCWLNFRSDSTKEKSQSFLNFRPVQIPPAFRS